MPSNLLSEEVHTSAAIGVTIFKIEVRIFEVSKLGHNIRNISIGVTIFKRLLTNTRSEACLKALISFVQMPKQ